MLSLFTIMKEPNPICKLENTINSRNLVLLFAFNILGSDRTSGNVNAQERAQERELKRELMREGSRELKRSRKLNRELDRELNRKFNMEGNP